MRRLDPVSYRIRRPTASGYTQLTEERGDEVAAHVAGRLASLVTDISRSRGGRPVRWLGAVNLKGVARPLPVHQAFRGV
jgi:hypothetical protein